MTAQDKVRLACGICFILALGQAIFLLSRGHKHHHDVQALVGKIFIMFHGYGGGGWGAPAPMRRSLNISNKSAHIISMGNKSLHACLCSTMYENQALANKLFCKAIHGFKKYDFLSPSPSLFHPHSHARVLPLSLL